MFLSVQMTKMLDMLHLHFEGQGYKASRIDGHFQVCLENHSIHFR